VALLGGSMFVREEESIQPKNERKQEEGVRTK